MRDITYRDVSEPVCTGGFVKKHTNMKPCWFVSNVRSVPFWIIAAFNFAFIAFLINSRIEPGLTIFWSNDNDLVQQKPSAARQSPAIVALIISAAKHVWTLEYSHEYNLEWTIICNFLIFQSALGAEGTSLEFRHIATYLMWYCSHFTACEDLLHEVILIVGYFTVLNLDNQVSQRQKHQTPFCFACVADARL